MALQPAASVLGRRSPPFVLALWSCIASVDLGALSGRYRCRWIHRWYHTVIVWGHSEVGILLYFCCCLYYPWLKCTRCSWGIWRGWILSLFELSFWWLSLVLWKKCSPSETRNSLSGRKWKSLFASDSLWCCGHGILLAWILEWVAFPFSRGSSQPRGQTQVSSWILYQLSYMGSPHSVYCILFGLCCQQADRGCCLLHCVWTISLLEFQIEPQQFL